MGLIFGLLIFGLILSGSLGEKSVPKKAGSSSPAVDKNMEIKKTACYSAASYGECEKTLSETKIATAEECCALFEKCCINN